MKLRTSMLIITIAMVLRAQTVDAEVMLQRAIRKESVQGDLKGAIEMYRKIVAGAAKNRAAAAKALLRLGECYEKQGNAEAQRAYERLVREFGDQKEQAHDAGARLLAMGRNGRGSKTISAQLIAKGDANGFDGRVTPDGKLYPFIDPETGDVAVRDLRTGTVRRLTNEGTLGQRNAARGYAPIPSRDSRQIAYEWQTAPGRNEWRVINVDGTGMRKVPLKGSVSNVWDWSPDGKMLAADGPGAGSEPYGIATVDVATGDVRRVGRSAGFGDLEVAGFSRDAGWIVYSRQVRGKTEPDWDIYAMDVNTRQETVVVSGPGRDRAPVWVPDSDTIVFRSNRSGKSAIWMVRFKDGRASSAPELVKAETGDYTPNGISRDGSFFYTLRNQSRDLYQAIVDPQTVRATRPPTPAVETYLGHNWAPSWAPTGDSFAYYSEREANASRLVIHHPNGTESVAKEPIRADQIPWTEYPIHWCGSGDRLLAQGATEGGRAFVFDGSTAATLKEQLAVSPGTLFPYQPVFAAAAFSHDCGLVYFSAFSQETKQRRIYKYDLTTGDKSDLLTDNGEPTGWLGEPLISPDGRWLAMHGKPEGNAQLGILILSTTGGPLRMLDAEGLRRNYSWSQDGKRLLYARRVNGENELYWISPEAGTPQATGIRMPGLAHPSLNADGTKLLFGAATTVNEFWVLRNLPLGVIAKSR